MMWNRPSRFRRVCPLLVETPDGLRCSADTADVRPFWGITLRYYGGTLLAIYTAVVLTVFIFLRTIGYPVSIVHVALPPLWHKVGQAQGWFFGERARRAFAAGDTSTALLYLANSFELSPNYDAGIALAKAWQAGQPVRSDEIFTQLLRDYPERRDATAQDWFRALLARGDFEKIAALSRDETLRDRTHAQTWLRALLFATRQSHNDEPLRAIRQISAPAAVIWHQLIDTELLVRAGRTAEAKTALLGAWPANAPLFTIIYRVGTLTDLHETFAALDLLETSRLAQRDIEAWLTLRFDALAAAGARGTLLKEVDSLLQPPLNQPTLKVICAQLINHPDSEIFRHLLAKLEREPMPLTDQTAGGWFALLCTAGAVGDREHLHAIGARLREASHTPFLAVQLVENFFQADSGETRANSFLPFLPVPLEVTYALLERYPAAQAKVPASP
jgi:plasmid stabilization system protein ParE